MNFVYRLLYKLSPKRYENILLDEYVKDVPEETMKPSVQILYDYHKKLTKLNDFLAYHLHRRMANDPKNSERYQGMLVQMKLYMLMIESAKRKQAPQENQKVRNTKWYDNAVEGVKKFIRNDNGDNVA